MQAHQRIRDRLRQELDRRGLTAVDLARSAGVKTSFIYDILNGKSTNPSTVKLAQVAESLELSLSYLAGADDGAPIRAASAHIETDSVAIPSVTVMASPKDGAFVTVETMDTPFCFRRGWIRDCLGVAPEMLRMRKVTDDSMEPTLESGDMLLIDTGRTSPSPPGIFVLFDGHGLVAKRLECTGSGSERIIRVISDNPQYGTYERAAKEIHIIGRVLWFARTL